MSFIPTEAIYVIGNKVHCRRCTDHYVRNVGDYIDVATTWIHKKKPVNEHVHKCSCGRYAGHDLSRDAIERIRTEVDERDFDGDEGHLKEAYPLLNIRSCSNCGTFYGTRCPCRKQNDLPVYHWEHDCRPAPRGV